MVSGDASAVFIKSLFSTIGAPLSRVSSIIAPNSFVVVIGEQKERISNLQR
jgi:hypothetical protein